MLLHLEAAARLWRALAHDWQDQASRPPAGHGSDTIRQGRKLVSGEQRNQPSAVAVIKQQEGKRTVSDKDITGNNRSKGSLLQLLLNEPWGSTSRVASVAWPLGPLKNNICFRNQTIAIYILLFFICAAHCIIPCFLLNAARHPATRQSC